VIDAGPLPETILQFGGGNFLRAFVDLFIDEANRSGQHAGRVVVVQSTRSGVAEQINRQRGRYHVIVRGICGGKVVDEAAEVNSISRAIDSQSNWGDVLEFATSPELRMIVSNTTEAGMVLDAADRFRPAGKAPVSFPAKLLDVLWHRFDAGQRETIAILPCELLPKNGERLQKLVIEQAAIWHADFALLDFLCDGCAWMNSLVDRIVSGKPAVHPLLERDALLTVTEPYALWAVERNARGNLFSHPAIELVEDTGPIELRKVRILNGAHTALVIRAMPLGIETVKQAVEDSRVGPWLKRLLAEEIVPTIDDRVPDAAGFVASTFERFANPFLHHRLESIALNHAAKVKTRLIPTQQEYMQKFGKRPRLLDELLEHGAEISAKK
jgi:tagaturonate reductase